MVDWLVYALGFYRYIHLYETITKEKFVPPLTKVTHIEMVFSIVSSAGGI